MKCQMILTIATLFLAAPAVGQVRVYDHRSTAYGDYAAGQAELEAARGRAAVDRAYAYELRMRAERQRQYLIYDRLEARQLAEDSRRQRSQAAAETRAKRAAWRQAQTAAAAERLAAGIKQGTYVWPKLLATPGFAGERAQIEQILQDWIGGSVLKHQSLTEIIKQLRAKTLDPQAKATHLERVQALRVVTQLEYLATVAGNRQTVAKR